MKQGVVKSKRGEMVRNFKKVLNVNRVIPINTSKEEYSDEEKLYARESRNQRIAFCFVLDILDDDSKLLENVAISLI
jgi:hypothetical protein